MTNKNKTSAGAVIKAINDYFDSIALKNNGNYFDKPHWEYRANLVGLTAPMLFVAEGTNFNSIR